MVEQNTMVPFESIWPHVAPLIKRAERPSRYINHEWHSTHKASQADFRLCMVYPDTYEIGQANQALRILVNGINQRPHLAAERAFLPGVDMCDMLRENQLPLFSLESSAPLAAFDVIGVTLPHELAATNVLELLDLAGVSLRATDRGEEESFVVAGGPCAFNPEPYAAFFDAFNIGEGEQALPEGLECMREARKRGVSRKEILLELAQIPGWYVPQFYRELTEAQAQERGSWVEPIFPEVPARIEKRYFDEFANSPAWETCIVPFTEVIHDRLNVEVLRGCARGCRFCQAGMMYRPVRERSCDNIVAAVEKGLAQTGYEEVSLTSLSTTDHSQIAEILDALNKRFGGSGIRVSIPSQRLDAFGSNMASLVAGQKKGGLTFAPEAGTQRLRDVINKNVTEQDLFSAIDAAFREGWRRCKLYFMVGLPTETDDDVIGIADLLRRVYDHACELVPKQEKGSVHISASLALFVPKAQTPFQWDGQISCEEANRRVDLVRCSLKRRAVSVSWHDPKTSSIEAFMSRAGREAADLIEAAWKNGARFDAWSEHFNEEAWNRAEQQTVIKKAPLAQRSYDIDYVMPWSHISCGASQTWMQRERKRAEKAQTTPDCTFGECSGCGVCDVKAGRENVICGQRGGEVHDS